ncbi:MAG: glycosyltransferase [Myxococcota bacterium]
MTYLIVVPVNAYPISSDRFAIEGPFADHLRELAKELQAEVDMIRVAGVEMPHDEYERSRRYLGELSAERDRVSFTPLYRADTSRPALLLQLPRILQRIAKEVDNAKVVHAGPSHDLYRPIEFPALMFGAALGRTTISVTDIDNRESPRMMYTTGRWSRRDYLVARYLYDPVRDLQHRAIARACDLVLFKGDKLKADYGREKPNVRVYRDPGFSAQFVIDEATLEEKLAALDRDPVRFVYFGRYVPYKGVHHMIEAFAQVKGEGELHLMGAGPEEERLRDLVREHRLEGRVTFHQPVLYGPKFFEVLRSYHLLVAAPLGVDTPRSTWDAFACGAGLLAYDTEFYSGLANDTGAIELAPWADAQALGKKMQSLVNDRNRVRELARRAAETARENPQEAWIRKRVEWTREILEQHYGKPGESPLSTSNRNDSSEDRSREPSGPNGLDLK